ncbi:hypothetical protein P692DRAFT_201724563 [Suillus brevipes Sb2]|nr:hypothetical protein P692DRAFT_201724563 [Suillus brevipes Sb2]
MSSVRLTHGAGIQIVFLPPYSPDLNQIEEAFLKFNAWIRQNYANIINNRE